MWGEALVIAPIIEQGVFSREVYLPENEIWYDFNTLEQISAGDIIVGNENDTFSVVPVFARLSCREISIHEKSQTGLFRSTRRILSLLLLEKEGNLISFPYC